MNTEMFPRPTWVEINLDAVTNNYQEFKRIIDPDVHIIAALKANGYGHGLIPIAKHCIKLGAVVLAVGNPYEGMRLRKAGIDAPIKVFGSTLPESAKIFDKFNLMPTFAMPEDPEQFIKVLGSDVKLKVWIKVETGLGRLGVFPKDILPMLKYIKKKTPYNVEGIYTHIGGRAQIDCDADQEYCKKQWLVFESLMKDIKEAGYEIPYYQVASSHATAALPQSWANCISLGANLYSNDITPRTKFKIKKENAYQALRSKLISVKHFPKGSQIGGVILERNSIIGVAPIGLGDGLSAKNSGQDVLIKGTHCKIISSVSLEHIRIDITDVKNPNIGDVVTIIGTDGKETITVVEMCKRMSVSSAQFWTSLNTTTIPYVFFQNGEIIDTEIC